MKKIIIVGAFHETVELCELCNYEIIGIIDGGLTGEFMGYPILGSDKDTATLYAAHKDCLLVISPDSSRVKRKLANLYTNIGFDFATVISPKANISRTATIGKGVVIQSGVNISSSAIIGDFCKLNFNCNIMHDVTIDVFSIIAPNAVILGRVHIGSDVYIGANSTVMSDVAVSDNSKVSPASFISE